jgi:hypothetical protein
LGPLRARDGSGFAVARYPALAVILVRPAFLAVTLVIPVVCATVTVMVNMLVFLLATNGAH